MHSALTVRMFTRCVAVTFAGLLFLAQTHVVEAAPIVFNDRAAFNAAAQPNIFDDFSAPVQCTIVDTFCHLTYSGVTFSYDVADFPIVPFGPPQSIGSMNVGPTFVVGMDFSPLTALGFDVSPLGAFGLKLFPRILQPNGVEIFGSFTMTQPGFFGLAFDDGSVLTGLGLLPNQPAETVVAIDNLAAAAPAAAAVPVPEPATLLLFGAGAAAVLARPRDRLD